MLTKELVNISELTEMSALEMGLLAEKEQIHLQTDIQENLYAKVDESLYIRMLINLLSNVHRLSQRTWIYKGKPFSDRKQNCGKNRR